MKIFKSTTLFLAFAVFFVWAVRFDVEAINKKLNTPDISTQSQTKRQVKQIASENKIATTTPKAKISKPVVKKPATNLAVKSPAPITTQTQIVPQLPIDLVALNTAARAALVNILCQTTAGGPLSPVSGSGVVASSDGVILTAAHIAQFFLLKDLNGKDSVQCVIRVGSPAYATYRAELVYISPSWVAQNKTILLDAVPQGTGEHDYAFLRITGKIDSSPLPATFPFLPISLSEADSTGQFALLAAYPAGFLGGQSIVQNLFQSSAETTVRQIFTFSKNTNDLLSLPGTIISQGGSSGGAVVNSLGELEGIISTDTTADQTSGRDLNAITTAYINRDLMVETGSTIADILSSPAAYAQNFNAQIAPKLTEILTNAILKK